MRPRVVSRPSDQRCWEIATAAAFALFGVCLGSGLQASPIAWSSIVMIIAYCLGSVTVALAACRLVDVRFPLPGPPEPSFPILPDPPTDPRSDIRQALDANLPSDLGDALTVSGVPAQSADQRWLRLVNQLVEMADWGTWQDNVYPFFDPNSPWVRVEFTQRLQRTNVWIFSRTWPPGHPELREAIDTYGQVIADLLRTFQKHAEEHIDGKVTMTEPFYKKRGDWNPKYREDLAEYKHHVELLEDLALESTRYANHIADLVRNELDPDFRAEEGALLVRMVYGFFQVGLLKPEFRPQDLKNGQPYKGLQAFEDDRTSRDVSMKFDGSDPDDGG